MNQATPLLQPKQLSLLWARTLRDKEFFEASRGIINSMNQLSVDNKHLLKHQRKILQSIELYDDISSNKFDREIKQKNATKHYNECRDQISDLVVGINYMLEGLKRSPIDDEVIAAKYVQQFVDDAGGSLSNKGRNEVMMWCENMKLYIEDDAKLKKMITELNLNRYFDKVILLGDKMLELFLKRGSLNGERNTTTSIRTIREDMYRELQNLVETLRFLIRQHKDERQYLLLNRTLYYFFRTYNALSKRRTTIRNKKKLQTIGDDLQSQQQSQQVLKPTEKEAKAVQAQQQANKKLLEELWANQDTLSVDEIVNSPIILDLFAANPDGDVFRLLHQVVAREVGVAEAIQ